MFSAKSRVSYHNLQMYHKKLVGLKKKFMKKVGPRRILWLNFWIFFRKKIWIFQKTKIFECCYFIFKHGEKKKFFFEKIFDPDFDPNFDFYFGHGIVLFQNFSIFFNFFSIFMTQRTVLVPSELDPALSPHYERA